MKITIRTLAKLGATSVAQAIESIATESESIASGTIGSAFSTSGPGSGWTRNHDVTDFARRALGGDFGAASYIDSDDGREATLDSAGDVEWSDESVVEIIIPSVEEAIEDAAAAAIIIRDGVAYGADADDIDALAAKIAQPYRISDGNATEYAATLDDAESIVEDWYDYLTTGDDAIDLPAPALDSSDLDLLVASIVTWEEEIAAAMGKEAFAGHGSYHVSAADRAGLRLTVSVRE